MSKEFKPKSFLSFVKPFDVNYFGLTITIDNSIFDGIAPNYIACDNDGEVSVHNIKPRLLHGCWISDAENITIGRMKFTGDPSKSLARIKDIKIK